MLDGAPMQLESRFVLLDVRPTVTSSTIGAVVGYQLIPNTRRQGVPIVVVVSAQARQRPATRSIGPHALD
jgi:hypothetical protein